MNRFKFAGLDLSTRNAYTPEQRYFRTAANGGSMKPLERSTTVACSD
jgi:hypothetical protein